MIDPFEDFINKLNFDKIEDKSLDKRILGERVARIFNKNKATISQDIQDDELAISELLVDLITEAAKEAKAVDSSNLILFAIWMGWVVRDEIEYEDESGNEYD